MVDLDFIEKIAKKLTEAIPPSLHGIKQDLERNFRAVLQGAFAKFDLVTREEFDAQVNVLAKTRAKLETMEQKVFELETKLRQKARHKDE